MKRICIALSIPDHNKDEIAQSISSISIPKTVRTKREKWHLTLAFLGEKSQAEIDDIRCSLEHVSQSTMPFSYHTDSIEVFGHLNTPRLVLKIIPNPTLVDLQKKIIEAIHLDELRPFVPHITIGKLKHKKDSPHTSGIKTITFEAKEVRLIHSVLHPHGSDFFTLATFPLDKAHIKS